jgi:hypothetical protein
MTKEVDEGNVSVDEQWDGDERKETGVFFSKTEKKQCL